MSDREQAHIDAANQYTEGRKSKLQSARSPDESFLNAMTPQTVHAFQESQMKIIESLDVLHTKLSQSGIGGGSGTEAGAFSGRGSTGGIAIELELQNIRKWVESFK